MSRRSGVESLARDLRHVQEELSENLEKACAAPDVMEETTAEVERLGDTLLEAGRQAKEAAGLRRHIKLVKVLGPVLRGSTPPDEHPAMPEEPGR